jgi:hypothetical protein
MSQTITLTDCFKDGPTYLPGDTYDWAEFDNQTETWADWTSWHPDPTQLQLRIEDDLGVVAYRKPLLALGAAGVVGITLKVSQTGDFTGEETSIAFSGSNTYSYPKGRYYRYDISVDADSDNPIPKVFSAVTGYDTNLQIQLFNDLELADLVDSSGIKTVPTELSVINVQGTALQGELYVDDDYFIDYQNTTTGYVRDQITVANGGVATATSTEFPGYDAGDWDGITGVDYLRIDDFRSVFAFDETWTLEWWMKTSDDTREQFLFNIYDTSVTNKQVFNVMFQNDCITLHIDNPDAALADVIARSNGSVITEGWHHVAITCTPGSSATIWIDGVDETNSASATPSSLPSTTRPLDIGAWDFFNDGNHSSTGAYDGLIQWIRLSNNIRYSAEFTPHNHELTNDPNTVLLIQNTTDLPGEDYGSDNYIVEQQGGSVVVESKNPLRVKTVDHNGNEWDGTVDLVVRGLEKIQQTDNGIQ